MVKLQKTLKQRQRHAVRNSTHTAKLTPAEIRELNNAVDVVSKTGSQSSTKSNTARSRSRQSTTATPPISPDEAHAHKLRSHRNSVTENNSNNVLTPPDTPNGRRRSGSSTQGHHQQSYASGVIYAPRPRGAAQATFMSTNGLSSRPSSASSSTYRSLPTYVTVHVCPELMPLHGTHEFSFQLRLLLHPPCALLDQDALSNMSAATGVQKLHEVVR
jgi:hypothetical protein